MKTTNKAIKERYPVITIGYCDLQNLLSCRERDFHTSGIYGWNSDIYIVPYDNGTHKVAISTGYRPIKEINPSHELIKTYEQRARDIKRGDLRWDEKKVLIDDLLLGFITTVMKEA